MSVTKPQMGLTTDKWLWLARTGIRTMPTSWHRQGVLKFSQGFDIVWSGKFPVPKRKIVSTDNYIVASCIGIAAPFII